MVENHADNLDKASALTEEHVRASIEAHRNRAKRPRSEECVDCGQTIPEARQKATGGTDLCIECQSLLER